MLSPGNKKLYPAEWRQAFNRKVSEARRFLNDSTFEFVLEWVRCSPKNRLAKTMEKLEQLKGEYLALADEFCEKYDSIREDWKAFCEAKWPGSWEKMAPHYPANAQVLRRKFDMFWTITEIKAAEPPSKSTAPEVLAAYERAKDELEAKCQEAVETAFLDYQKRIREVVASLSVSLKEGKVIRNESLEKVRNLHTWAREMNIFGYKPLEEELAKLKAGLDGVDIQALKDNDGLKAQLAGLADQVAAVASKVEDVTMVSKSYKRMIDLS
ncbi:MAG: DUF3150 domain-containing protein [Deltaproteobacteria bacterium]|nr:MAG: DUF3150 domain-containing protein [Deltaproteobacteria bacterium]